MRNYNEVLITTYNYINLDIYFIYNSIIIINTLISTYYFTLFVSLYFRRYTNLIYLLLILLTVLGKSNRGTPYFIKFNTDSHPQH